MSFDLSHALVPAGGSKLGNDALRKALCERIAPALNFDVGRARRIEALAIPGVP